MRRANVRRCALGIAGALLVALAACRGGAPRLASGDPAPAFVLSGLDVGPLRFPDDFRGRPVVIRFWADQCRFCQRQMQDVEVLYQRRRGAGLTVLAVNVGQSRETVTDFVRRTGVTYPALMDQESSVARRYGVLSLPTTYFVDRGGTIRAKVLGEAGLETLERLALEIP